MLNFEMYIVIMYNALMFNVLLYTESKHDIVMYIMFTITEGLPIDSSHIF